MVKTVFNTMKEDMNKCLNKACENKQLKEIIQAIQEQGTPNCLKVTIVHYSSKMNMSPWRCMMLMRWYHRGPSNFGGYSHCYWLLTITGWSCCWRQHTFGHRIQRNHARTDLKTFYSVGSQYPSPWGRKVSNSLPQIYPLWSRISTCLQEMIIGETMAQLFEGNQQLISDQTWSPSLIKESMP